MRAFSPNPFRRLSLSRTGKSPFHPFTMLWISTSCGSWPSRESVSSFEIARFWATAVIGDLIALRCSRNSRQS